MQSGGSGTGEIKRLGDLLSEAGYLSAEDLAKALDNSKKNMMALGRVLTSFKYCTDADIKDALQVQSICKLEGMTGDLAVRTLSVKREKFLTLPDALKDIGWMIDGYNPMAEPDPVAGLKKKLVETQIASGDNHVSVGQMLIQVADAYLVMKLPARAEQAYVQAQIIFEKNGHAGNSGLLETLKKLAKLTLSQRRLKEAKGFLDKALDVACKLSSTHSEDYASVLYFMAELAESQRKYPDAEKLFSQALLIRSQIFDLKEPRVLEVIKRLGIVSKSYTREQEKVSVGDLLTGSGLITDQQLQEALDFGKKNGTPLGRSVVVMELISEEQLQYALQAQVLVRNRELASIMAMLAVRYSSKLKANFDETLELLGCRPKSRDQHSEELVKANNDLLEMEKQLPPDSPDIAYAYGKVAHLYFLRQQWIEAESFYKRGLSILKMTEMAPSEKVASFLDRYCELLMAQENYDQAIGCYKTSVQIRHKLNGQIALPVAQGLERLAICLCLKGDHSQAGTWFDKSTAIRERLYTPTAAEVLVSMEPRADCHFHEEKYLEAEATYRKAMDICEETWGRRDTNTQRICDKLIQTLKLLGETEKVNLLEISHKGTGILL